MKGLRRIHRACCRSNKFVRRNSTTIMTVSGCVGIITTVFFAVKATPKARELLNEAEKFKGDTLTKTEMVTVVAPVYLPAIITGISTVTLILGADILNRRQKASMIGAYAALQKTYDNHREKVKELFGEDADTIVRKAIAKDMSKECKTENLKEKEYWFYIPEFDVRFKATEMQVVLGEYHFNRNLALRGYADVKELLEFLGSPPIDYGTSIGWSEEAGMVYGYRWVDFDHLFNDGEYLISLPFAPTADYMECEWDY